MQGLVTRVNFTIFKFMTIKTNLKTFFKLIFSRKSTYLNLSIKNQLVNYITKLTVYANSTL